MGGFGGGEERVRARDKGKTRERHLPHRRFWADSRGELSGCEGPQLATSGHPQLVQLALEGWSNSRQAADRLPRQHCTTVGQRERVYAVSHVGLSAPGMQEKDIVERLHRVAQRLIGASCPSTTA